MTSENKLPDLTLTPIGYIRSCYQQNFSIPRQPGLAPDAPAVIIINRRVSSDPEQLLRGLESFSHLWVIFHFSNLKKTSDFSPMVRPPRLGGEKKTGSLASRSPYRPNPLGLSAVKILKTKKSLQGMEILVSGGDFLDHTPVLDLKPYLPYSDSLPAATSTFAGEASTEIAKVSFLKESGESLKKLQAPDYMIRSICQSLATDPRPSWRRHRFPLTDEKTYHSAMFGLDLRWKLNDGIIIIDQIILVNEATFRLFARALT